MRKANKLSYENVHIKQRLGKGHSFDMRGKIDVVSSEIPKFHKDLFHDKILHTFYSMHAATGRRGARSTDPHGSVFGSDDRHALHFGRAYYLASLVAMEVYIRPQMEVGAIESSTVYLWWFRARYSCVDKEE